MHNSSSYLNKPLAITMGDPFGIGPEIIAKTFAETESYFNGNLVIGDVASLQRGIEIAGVSLRIEELSSINDFRPQTGIMPVLQAGASVEQLTIGKIHKSGGQAAADAVCAAIDLAQAGEVAGLVTAPLHKEALFAAGINYPGHTEILSHRTGAKSVAMMLANQDIRIVLVTIHLSLLDAIKAADFDAQISAIRLANHGMRALGVETPKIAVAGLNPHAGEGGLFGREEIDIIAPAIEVARSEGIDVSGPWPGDTIFMQARQGHFDVVVAQYHDQGLIPVKYMGLDKGVNITLGLPFVRTSPDHGTAFDIAGQGIADPSSLLTAINYARSLVAAKAAC